MVRMEKSIDKRKVDWALKLLSNRSGTTEEQDNALEIIKEHHYCTECACEGMLVALGPWYPGNQNEWAGRECPECDLFITEGDYYESANQTDACYDNYSDADPGL